MADLTKGPYARDGITVVVSGDLRYQPRWDGALSRNELNAVSTLLAAAPALLEALTGGERENPQLRRIEWLDALLREISDGDLKWPDGPEDPDAAAEMLWELAEMVRQARAAIAAAKGEGE